MSKRAK